VYKLAQAVAQGAREVSGAQVDLKRVPETLPQDVLEKMNAIQAQKEYESIPIAQPNELGNYDCILFGTPGRFGNMAAQMKTFLDATGGLWMAGALVGKVGGVFCSTANQHGGQESVILTFMTYLFHQGMVVVGLPYTFQGQQKVDEVTGCSPYGASTIAGGRGERTPTKTELDGAHFQGKHAATIAAKLCKA
jgi:NAD(P)H dehydrogenase (quinone)